MLYKYLISGFSKESFSLEGGSRKNLTLFDIILNPWDLITLNILWQTLNEGYLYPSGPVTLKRPWESIRIKQTLHIFKNFPGCFSHNPIKMLCFWFYILLAQFFLDMVPNGQLIIANFCTQYIIWSTSLSCLYRAVVAAMIDTKLKKDKECRSQQMEVRYTFQR